MGTLQSLNAAEDGVCMYSCTCMLYASSQARAAGCLHPDPGYEGESGWDSVAQE